jgi:transposase
MTQKRLAREKRNEEIRALHRDQPDLSRGDIAARFKLSVATINNVINSTNGTAPMPDDTTTTQIVPQKTTEPGAIETLEPPVAAVTDEANDCTAVIDGEVVADLTLAEAIALTDKIRAAIDWTWELVFEAFIRRGWIAMGYESWDAYCDSEFGARLRLPPEIRQEWVFSLKAAGMSKRAIASGLGVSEGTVRNILNAGAQNYAPGPGQRHRCGWQDLPGESDAEAGQHDAGRRPAPAPAQRVAVRGQRRHPAAAHHGSVGVQRRPGDQRRHRQVRAGRHPRRLHGPTDGGATVL